MGPKQNNNQWRVQILHIYLQGTSHIPTSTILCHFHILPFPYSAISIFCHFHIMPCSLAMTAKQHGRIWKWIQNNLEVYMNLEGAIYMSPVQENNAFLFSENL